jgi:sulfotransferase
MSNKTNVYVTGLPRSGSTLICQLLAQHPDIFCDGMTSPLSSLLESTRINLSTNDIFLSRLDNSFSENYERLKNIYAGILNGWLKTDKKFSVDKNRGWLNSIDFISEIDQNFKMIVCVRELGQLFGSAELAHKKTALLGYRDGLSQHSQDNRALNLFSENGIVGSPLKSIFEYVNGFKYKDFKEQVYFVDYEQLVSSPVETMKNVYQFIGADRIVIDPEDLIVFPKESDSHYGMKWPHDTKNKIQEIKYHNIHPEITKTLVDRFSWYYQYFYPNFQKIKKPHQS